MGVVVVNGPVCYFYLLASLELVICEYLVTEFVHKLIKAQIDLNVMGKININMMVMIHNDP